MRAGNARYSADPCVRFSAAHMTARPDAVDWPRQRQDDLGGRPGRDRGLGQCPLVAAWYCSTTLAGMRPRALTAMSWSFAHARISPLRSRFAARPGPAALSPSGLAGMFDERCE